MVSASCCLIFFRIASGWGVWSITCGREEAAFAAVSDKFSPSTSLFEGHQMTAVVDPGCASMSRPISRRTRMHVVMPGLACRVSVRLRIKVWLSDKNQKNWVVFGALAFALATARLNPVSSA